MSHTAQFSDISASVRSPGLNRSSRSLGYDGSTATLHILPLHAKRLPEAIEWAKVQQTLGQIANLPGGWNAGLGVSPDLQTIAFAGRELANLQQMTVPAPTINPSPDGAIYAEWHMCGLDIELVFEAPYRITVLVEDARHELSPIEAESANLGIVLDAMKVLCSR